MSPPERLYKVIEHLWTEDSDWFHADPYSRHSHSPSARFLAFAKFFQRYASNTRHITVVSTAASL